MSGFRTLVERPIASARGSGQLSARTGEGKPLSARPAETADQAAQSAAVRISAEAGVVPEECPLETVLAAARRDYSHLTDPEPRKTRMAEIAVLELRCEIARESRRKFMS